LERADELVAPPCAVAVDPHEARAGKARRQRLFHALRAAPHRLEVDVAAGRARARNAFLGAAVMATKAPIGGVQDEVGGAASASGAPAAGLPAQHRRPAA